MPWSLRVDRDEARRMREAGLTYRQIAAQYGVTPVAVYKALQEPPSEFASWLRDLSPEERSEYRRLATYGYRAARRRVLIDAHRARTNGQG